MKYAVHAVIIDSGKLLIAEDENKMFKLLGGGKEAGENDEKALRREVKEEAGGMQIKDLKFYKTFTGISLNSGDKISTNIYFVNKIGEFRPSSEVKRIVWISYVERINFAIAHITQDVIDSLHTDGYLP